MIIKSLPNYQLKLVLTPVPNPPGTWSLELHQHFPQAQHPRWQRLVQLNLTGAELDQIADAIAFRFVDLNDFRVDQIEMSLTEPQTL